MAPLFFISILKPEMEITLEDPKIKSIHQTIKGTLIAEVNLKLIKDTCDFSDKYESELETLGNKAISIASLYKTIDCKQLYSDGFHYWMNNDGNIDFIFITEYKKGKLGNAGIDAALLQSIYYYNEGHKMHQGEDRVKYLIVVCSKFIRIYSIRFFKEQIDEICNLLNILSKTIKITGSTVYDKCTLAQHLLDDIPSYAYEQFDFTDEGLKDAMIYMRNDFETNG